MATEGSMRRGRFREPDFFKPILPPFEKLHIPIPFHKHLVDELSEEGNGEATLRNNRCTWKSWPVKINRFYFTDGWEDFLRDNDIQVGNLVFFRYEVAMLFHVFVFNSGESCEKEYPYPPPPPPPSVTIKKEDEKHESDHDCQGMDEGIKSSAVLNPPSGRRVMTRCNRPKATKLYASSSVPLGDSFKAIMRDYNLRKCFVSIPKGFSISNGLTRGKILKVILRDEKGKSWPVKVNRFRDQFRLGRGWNAFSSANQLKEGHSCLFKLVNSGPKIRRCANAIVLDVTIFKSCSRERRASVKNNERTEIEPSLPFQPPVTNKKEYQKHESEDILRDSFKAVIKNYNLRMSFVSIPKVFALSNGLRKGKILKVIPRDEKVKSWPVKVNQFNGVFRLGRGWHAFSSANHLKEGHSCLFKLVNSGQKMSATERRGANAIVLDVTIFKSSSRERRAARVKNNKPTETEIKSTPVLTLPSCNGPKATKLNASSSESLRDSFKAVIKNYNLRMSFVRIPKVFAVSNGLRKGKILKVILRDEKGKLWPVKVNQFNRVFRLGRGWHAFSSANHLKEEHSCHFKLVNSGPKIERGVNAIVLDVTISRSSSSERRAARVKNNERNETEPSLPSNQCFVTSLTPSNFKDSRINIPMEFARENGLIGKQCEMTLRNRKGMSWRVQLKHNKSNGTARISGDWDEIFGVNGLRKGDTCAFELVRRGKMWVMEFLLR